ncbi:MAG TPA: zinc ribbon domain-containing protein, partial [Deltaproteobacteria bacterium]|nr:zinc ribbon domain-containing protein [Deltaproteobacteria bacterium]
IYEYKCQKCGKQYESLQGINDPGVKSCKFCRGKVQKLVSMTSFTLKGTGWYATDYAGKKPQAAKKQDKETASTDSSTSTEAKSTGTKED